MKVGVVFPITEIGTDPAIIRDFGQAAEELGFNHILAFDHVISADPLNPVGRQIYVHHATPFHEPLLLFSYLAGLTRRIEFTTGVLILPQRPTVLVAKQVAELDILSRGRVRLGVGLGWNETEYRALGADFHSRGRRIEEQIGLLRRLWSQPIVSFNGRDHELQSVGIVPRPSRGAIPIWMGGLAGAALRRMARLADGWICPLRPDTEAPPVLAELTQYLSEAGRDPAEFGIEGRVNLAGNPDRWLRHMETWRTTGATHASVATMGIGLEPHQHIQHLARFAAEFGLARTAAAG